MFNDLFQFLHNTVVAKCCLGRVYGPPGIGKSLAMLAFSSTLVHDGWKVIWLHLSDRHLYECIRFHDDRKETTFFHVGDLDQILPHTVEHGSKLFVILDGIRDSISFPKHQEVATKCRQWYLMHVDPRADSGQVRLVENSSMSSLELNTEETDRMLATEPFCMFSWAQSDYNVAVEHKEFREQIMQNLDVEIDDSDLEDEGTALSDGQDLRKVRALLKAKFFFSGGSARYMFSYTTKQVKESICKAVDSEQDVTRLLRGLVGATSSQACHRLAGCYPHPNPVVSTSCICTILSRFASERVAMKAGPDAIEVLANSLQHDMNPSMEGWIFEMLFFSRLRLGGVYFVDKDQQQHVWQSSGDIITLKGQSLGELTGDKFWLKPQRWNQGGYDAVFVDKIESTIRFVQVTKGKKHAFKIRHFRKLLDQFKVETVCVEIFFLIPTTNVNEFTISEVTGEGQLATFKADATGSIMWTKSKETTLVQIVGMEHR